MNVSVEQVLWVIGAGATLATTLFYGAFYLGQIWSQLKTLRVDVDRHEETIQHIQTGRRATDRLA